MYGLLDAANGYLRNIPTLGFTQTEYESSPLNRPIRQYAGGSGTPVGISYQTNVASDVKRYIVILSTSENTSPALVQSTDPTYAANSLSYIETTDEDNNKAREYKDKLGRTILKRVYQNTTNFLDTYYVYNELGQLSFVLQPQYQETTDINLFAFRYTYNKKGLLTKKLIPGGGETELSYDDRDRLATSKDARGRTIYYTYDGLNRPTETGEVLSNGTRVPLTRTYYDKYDGHADYARIAFDSSAYVNTYSENVRGLVVATATRVLMGSSQEPSASWYFTTNYYNDRQQLIQTTRNLYDFPGTAKETHSRRLRFDGLLLAEKIEQNISPGLHSVEKTFTYDQADRLLSTQYIVRKGTAIQRTFTLAAQRYDGIGQLQQKFLHSANSAQFREKLDYKYTPRTFLSTIQGQTSTGINFGLDLRYEVVTAGATAQKNGNIAQLLWKKDVTNWSGFSYTYDGASRLKEAKGIAGYNYEEIISSYDKNGNIQGLIRKGEGNAWDDLTYTYSGNRLNKVNDATGNAKGFDNGTSGQNEDYTYDAAGNLTRDANRGIAANGIKYNLLNLIGSVQMDSVLTYDYDALGNKVRMTRGGVYHTRYVGVFEYDENYFLTRIATEEGQIRVSNGGNSYAIEYYLKDHLGNVRAVLDTLGNKVQETEYFAFGLAIPKTTGSNKYFYNGKELQPKTGFLDYGARQYDAAIGRWMSVDPKAEKMISWSPYNYAFNNPVLLIDPDGQEPIDPNLRLFTNTNSAKSVLTNGFNANKYGKYSNYNWFSSTSNATGTGRAGTGVTLGIDGIDVSNSVNISNKQMKEFYNQAKAELGYTSEQLRTDPKVRSEVDGLKFSKLGKWMNETGAASYKLGDHYAVTDAVANKGVINSIHGSSGVIKALNGLKIAGRTLMAVGVALDSYEIYSSSFSPRVVTGVVGGWAGAALGATGGTEGGAAVGTLFGPGPGTLVGGALGGLAGGILGYFGGRSVSQTVYDTISQRGMPIGTN